MPRFVFVFFFLYFLLGISVKFSNFVEVRLVSTTVVVDRLIFFFLNYLLLIFFIWVLSKFAYSAKLFFFFFFRICERESLGPTGQKAWVYSFDDNSIFFC